MLTFIDSGILIVGWRGQAAARIRALTILRDPGRQFVSSPFVQLEVLPKSQHFKQQTEEAFYQTYFAGVSFWVTDCDTITQEALKFGRLYGLGALDALHIAAAVLANATEFITTERSTSPLSRVKEIKVVSLASS